MGILDKIKKIVEKRKIKKLSKFWTIDKSQIEWKDNDKKYNVTLKWSDNTKPIPITLDAVSQNFTIADTKDKIQGAVRQLLNEVGEAVVDVVKNINKINSSNLLIALEQFRELVGFIVSKDGKGTNFKLVTQIVSKDIKFDHWTEEYTFPCYKQISQEGCIYFFYIESIKEYFEKNIDDADYINKKISVLEEKYNSRQGDVTVEELIKILKAELEHGNQSMAKQSICQTIAQLKKDLNDNNINEDNFFANITNEKAEAFIKRSYLGLAKIKRICDIVTEFSKNNKDNKYRKKMEEVYFYFDNDEVRALEKKCTGRYSDETISIVEQFSNEPKLNILFQKLRTLKRAVDLATCKKKKDVAKYVEYITEYNNNPNANAVNSINKIANTSIQKRIKKVKIGIVIAICILIAAVLPINIYNQEIRYYFIGGYQYSSQSAEFEFRKYDDSGAEIISAIPTRDDGLVEFPAQVELDESEKYKINVVAIGSEVFGENADTVKSIIVPANITYIGEKAFKGCSSLESITFEDGSKLTKIDSNAFEGCSKLEQINIPSSVTEIGENAFSGCSSLTSIIIPDSVTSIGSGAFSGCSGLESITIPFAGGTVKTESDTCQYPFGYIFGNTFYSGSVAVDQYYYGSSVSDAMRTTYYIPASLKNVKVTGGNILYNAFYNCSNLTNIAIPDGVTSIGDYAFYGCSGLINIVIPNGVTSIGNRAFYNCDSLATITIPYSVTSIGEYAFYNCNSLIIYCEKASEPIGWNKKWNYSNCPVVWDNSDIATYYVADNGIRYVINNGAAMVIRQSTALSGEIIIPEEITYNDSTYAVTTINASAFLNCNSMTSITIPNSVTSIGGGAFSDCSGLTSITIPFVGGGDSKNTHFGYIFGASSDSNNNRYVPSSLKEVVITGGESIGERTFYDCDSLTSITIPEGVTSIGDYTFCGCSSLESIDISNSVTSIGRSAFVNCDSLTSITIPDGVKSVGDWAFNGCSSLESITIPEGVTNIGEGVLYGCSGLIRIVIPNSVTSIGYGAFLGCSGLTSITIPSSITSIGNYAFYDCDSLKEVHISDIAAWCKIDFDDNASNPLCYARKLYLNDELITQLEIPKGITSIKDRAFFNCESITKVTIPDGVKSIGDYAFYICSGITSITIPNGIKSIGNGALQHCISLASITIPGSVTSIGDRAFSDCRDLTSITIPDSVTSIGSGAFSGCRGLTSITIPDSVTNIGSGAFSDCSGLTSITIPFVGGGDSKNTHFGYIFGASGYSYNSSYVPSTLKEVVITGGTSIGSNAFYGCRDLTSITIPDSVTSIGYNAFA